MQDIMENTSKRVVGFRANRTEGIPKSKMEERDMDLA